MMLVTPVGKLWLNANDHALIHVSYSPIKEEPNASQEVLQLTAKQLKQFFARERTTFDLPYEYEIGTPFQQLVWEALRDIPYGSTCSYQEVACQIDRPKAVRAVGQANRKNPLPIIVPCHRVIGKNGQLTGYTGSSPEGLVVKHTLLSLETQN